MVFSCFTPQSSITLVVIDLLIDSVFLTSFSSSFTGTRASSFDCPSSVICTIKIRICFRVSWLYNRMTVGFSLKKMSKDLENTLEVWENIVFFPRRIWADRLRHSTILRGCQASWPRYTKQPRVLRLNFLAPLRCPIHLTTKLLHIWSLLDLGGLRVR